jgi:branched-chain amino acid aminotransferase
MILRWAELALLSLLLHWACYCTPIRYAAAATLPRASHAAADPSIEWDSFGFSLNGVKTDFMWLDRVGDDNISFSESEICLRPLGSLELHPACTVLNYGQALFEGMKAFRRADGSIALFRPERNALRMKLGAERLCLHAVPIDTFVNAADSVVRANARWVPPFGKGALYLRPLLFGSGADLGVKPSSETTFCIYCSPVGNYFKGTLRAIRLQAVRGYTRAAPGGSGGVKASGNYAPAFLVQREVKQRGYDEALFLDANTGEAIEEAGASNFFAVFSNNTIVTPCLSSGTILPGVTRSSIIKLAREECGCTVVEGRLGLDDLQGACEAFCCGTGASITPVGSVSVTSKENPDLEDRPIIVYGDGSSPGPLTQRLYDLLLNIQMGNDARLNEKYGHWIHLVEP